jgi:two-component system, LuxR family, sensor kinase FixL
MGGKRAAAALAGAAQARDLIGPVAFILAYVALEWVSYGHEHMGVPVTPWNPGVGLAFGLIVLKSAAYGLALLVGVVVAEILVLDTQLPWPAILAVAVVVAATYTLAAAFARRQLHLYAMGDVRDVLVLLSAGTGGAAIVALLFSALLLIDREAGNNDLLRSVLPLFVGDVIGIAVVTPLLLRLSRLWQQWALWKDWVRSPPFAIPLEVALFVLVTGFALWMIVGSDRPNDYKYFSLLFLPVVVVAVRHGFDGACLALASTQLGLVALLRAYGYDAATFTEFQIVMLVLTMTGLLVGGVVSERERATQAVRLAEARLREAELEAARTARFNMVSGMASALAHEINQPMTAARALARSAQQLIGRQGSAGSTAENIERARGNLANLVTQIDHAAGVIRRMRDFLRRGQPHVSTLDVAGVLEDALVLARPEAAAHGIRIDLSVDPALPDVFGDRIQLQQVVMNLVRNGIEAIVEAGGPPKAPAGRIAVRAFVGAGGRTVEVSVADNGTGIASDRDLFSPLTSSKKDGLGLGLSICANIVEAHGGRIWLQSGERGATEFRFSLPLQPEP